MDIEYTKSQVVIRTDVAELLAWGKNPAASKVNARHLARHNTCSASFLGMERDRARNLTDWSEGLALVEKYRRLMPEMPQMTTVKRRLAWRDDGDDFDRDRFDAGFDDCWRTRVKTQTAGNPVIRLTCAIGANANRSASELVWSGAVAAAVCDAAESAGWRVEIDAIAAASTYETCDKVEIVSVKAAADPLDLSTTVLALACPAFFRWHVLGSGAIAEREVKDTFGKTMDTPAEFQGDIHIGHCYTQSAAEAELRRIIGMIESMSTAVPA